MAGTEKPPEQIEPEVEEFLSVLAKIAARLLTPGQAERDNKLSERRGSEVEDEGGSVHKSKL